MALRVVVVVVDNDDNGISLSQKLTLRPNVILYNCKIILPQRDEFSNFLYEISQEGPKITSLTIAVKL